jgi:VCBS repeat-containing protein
MSTFNGGAGNDALRGTNGADWIYGGSGDDTLNGLGGNDVLFGGTGRDTLDGGSGSDYVDGGLGADLLIYRFGENRNSHDIYNGGFGNDTLRLVFTAAEWAAAAVKADVARFLAYLPEYNEPLGWISDPVFTFRSMGLSVIGINKLEVVVDGKIVNIADAPVVTANDVLAVSENEGATVDVLANDWVADGVRSVSITQPAKGKVELVSTDFAAETPSAVFRFVPGDAFDALKAGETATQVFTYTVTDKDGDKKTASVQVTITGTNDAPVARADAVAAAGDGVITGDVGLNDTDVDGAPQDRSFYVFGFDRPTGFNLSTDGSWSFDPQFNYEVLRLVPGQSVTFEIPYIVIDDQGESSVSMLTLTVAGVNDAPIFLYALDNTIYEDSLEPGETVVIESIFGITDYDDGSSYTVTLLDAPADYLGELVLTGTDDDGNVTYRFEIDAAIVKALDEGQELIQTYRIVIDDGQGGVVTESFDITVIGDGNDPVELDFQLSFLDEYADVDGFRTGEIKVRFTDEDTDDVHTAVVEWLGDDALGAISVSGPVMDEDRDGDGYFVVRYAIPLELIDARDDAFIQQAFRIVIKDAAGSQVEYERTVDIRGDGWAIGGEGNDDIQAFGGEQTRHMLVGGTGADRLKGGDGRDLLFGDAGPALPDDAFNDFFGEEWTPVAGFDDQLDGGAGADVLTGGSGADRFVFRAGEADRDLVTDFDAAAGDRLEFLGWGPNATFTYIDGDKWEIATFDRETVEVITLTGVTELPASAYAFVEILPAYSIGSTADEGFSVSSEVNNIVVGAGGRDALTGGELADELYGDEGPALPEGAANAFTGYDNDSPAEGFDDTLDGYGGADRLTGGDGADLFVFYFGEANGDVVTDFDAAEGDRIEFRGYGENAVLERIGDTDQWRIRSLDGFREDVITFLGSPDITTGDYYLL